nr:CoA transferase [Microbacterium halimionae]
MALALGTTEIPDAVLSPRRIAASYRSDQLFRLNGEPPAAWAPRSGFFATADGWVRTHANYPHHDSALRTLLGLESDATPEDLARALSEWSGVELETRAAEVGAIVGAYRSADTWAKHPQAKAVAAAPLIEVTTDTVGTSQHPQPISTGFPAPLQGIRVLDLTRVIAGPVATRTLALLGADVLRIDNPRRPEIAWQHLDTGQGKHSGLLDFAAADDLRTFHELLAGADVVVTGYRPDALTRFGLDDDVLAASHPGLIRGRISAWGTRGPWAHRRGFDSIVQTVSGIAAISSPEGSHHGARPGALPAQALDHTAGYLLASGIMSALRRRACSGAGGGINVSLARIAQELLAAGTTAVGEDTGPPTDHTVHAETTSGDLECAASVFTQPELPDRYPTVGRAWGIDPARWTS